MSDRFLAAVNLPIGALALLSVIVDLQGRAGLADFLALRHSFDTDAIVENLQLLLDRGLATRCSGRNCYHYAPTTDGVVTLRAHLHPAGNSLENLA